MSFTDDYTPLLAPDRLMPLSLSSALVKSPRLCQYEKKAHFKS